MNLKSRLGWGLAIGYLAVCGFLIYTQGLFGESFIALILGFPWTFALAYFEFFNASGWLAAVLALAPIALNAVLLCWIGSRFEKKNA